MGLLVDLYGPDLETSPGVWKIEVGDGWGGGMSSGKAVEDAWVNGVKEVRVSTFRLIYHIDLNLSVRSKRG